MDTEDIGEPPDASLPERGKDLSKNPAIINQLLPIFKDVEQGFVDQNERANNQMDYWDIYNCKLGPKQYYTGNSKIFIPIVHNAVNARITRFVNQIFPQSGRYVEVTSEDGTLPQATMALLEHYVNKTRLRTEIMPALIRNGDVEGQYTLYLGWKERKRHVAWKVQKPPQTPDGLNIPGEDMEDIREETISDCSPDVEVINDADFLVMPPTADSIDEAICCGGSATILRRWSKAKVRQMVREGVIDDATGKSLIGRMSYQAKKTQFDPQKAMTDAAGIKTNESGVKYALVYESWCEIKVRKERRIVQAFYGGESIILGARLNPYWSDRVPILSCPAEKVSGSFKGQSKVKFCADAQYAANDALNIGLDSAAFSLMPVVMTDPEKNPWSARWSWRRGPSGRRVRRTPSSPSFPS